MTNLLQTKAAASVASDARAVDSSDYHLNEVAAFARHLFPQMMESTEKISMLNPRRIFAFSFLMYLVYVGAGTARASDSVLWIPTQTDRQSCQLPKKLIVSTVARVSYTEHTRYHQLSVFKAELPNARLILAASILGDNQSQVPPPQMECLAHLNYSQFLRASELPLGPTSRALRIDTENISGAEQMTLVVGEVDGKVVRLLNFMSLETCDPEHGPCWNYSRTMAVLPSSDKKLFYDVRFDKRSWCTRKNSDKCVPKTGTQDYTVSEVLTFENGEYRRR